MITNNMRRKRRQFDDDADWLPQKDRLFVLKQPLPPEVPEAKASPLPPPVQAPTLTQVQATVSTQMVEDQRDQHIDTNA